LILVHVTRKQLNHPAEVQVPFVIMSDNHPAATWLESARVLRPLMISLYPIFILFTFSGHLYLPFIRSTVVCDTPVDPAIPNDSPEWSGSNFCGDRTTVITEAQRIDGFLITTKLVCRAVAYPFLGAVADSIGRLPVVRVGFIGTLISFLLLWIASVWPAPQQATIRQFIIGLGFVLQGASSAFGALAMTMIADITTARDRATYVTVYTVTNGMFASIGAAVALGVIKMYITNYAMIWATVLVLCIVQYVVMDRNLRETGGPTVAGGQRDAEV
jgi:MFS family permease